MAPSNAASSDAAGPAAAGAAPECDSPSAAELRGLLGDGGAAAAGRQLSYLHAVNPAGGLVLPLRLPSVRAAPAKRPSAAYLEAGTTLGEETGRRGGEGARVVACLRAREAEPSPIVPRRNPQAAETGGATFCRGGEGGVPLAWVDGDRPPRSRPPLTLAPAPPAGHLQHRDAAVGHHVRVPAGGRRPAGAVRARAGSDAAQLWVGGAQRGAGGRAVGARGRPARGALLLFAPAVPPSLGADAPNLPGGPRERSPNAGRRYSIVCGIAAAMETCAGQAFGARQYALLGLILQVGRRPGRADLAHGCWGGQCLGFGEGLCCCSEGPCFFADASLHPARLSRCGTVCPHPLPQCALALCLLIAGPTAALWASGAMAPILVRLGQLPDVAAAAGGLLQMMWPVLPLLAVSETMGQCRARGVGGKGPAARVGRWAGGPVGIVGPRALNARAHAAAAAPPPDLLAQGVAAPASVAGLTVLACAGPAYWGLVSRCARALCCVRERARGSPAP